MEKFKKYFLSSLVFLINIFLLIFGYQLIKNSDKDKTVIENDEADKAVQNDKIEIPVLPDNEIISGSTAPQEIKNEQIIINSGTAPIKSNTAPIQVNKTAPVAPAPAPKKSSTKTKTS